MSQLLMRMTGVTKYFPGVRALGGVQFDLMAGEVHALLGENGAGKSTLIKILGGIHRADEGTVEIDGLPVDIRSIQDAQAAGISIIHQELFMVPDLTVAQNLFLGREPMKPGFPLVMDVVALRTQAQALIDSVGLDLSADSRVSTLSIAQQQMVEIVKAVSFDARILVMDEPTSSLTAKETLILYELIDRLKKTMAIIYISHRMEELFRLSDRVTVLRDGQSIGTRVTNKTTSDELIEMMVGRKLQELFTKTAIFPQEVVLEVDHLCRGDFLKDISFQVRKGEILGISGIVGAGRTELMQAVCGIVPADAGQILVKGVKVRIRQPQDAIRRGIVMVPESRKEQGLVLTRSVGFNLTLQTLGTFIKGIFVNHRVEDQIVEDFRKQLSIKTPSAEVLVEKLSGGNQQKVVIAKWLATEPMVLILDEPTRGIDVGAKAEIYAIMDSLARKGVAIIMVSSDLPEILNMSDRVLVMYHGQVAAELPRDQLSQELIMKHATGDKK